MKSFSTTELLCYIGLHAGTCSFLDAPFFNSEGILGWTAYTLTYFKFLNCDVVCLAVKCKFLSLQILAWASAGVIAFMFLIVLITFMLLALFSNLCCFCCWMVKYKLKKTKKRNRKKAARKTVELTLINPRIDGDVDHY